MVADRHTGALGDGGRADDVQGGLLFELTHDGCRVSNLGAHVFKTDESVRIHVPGFGELEGRVRQAAVGAIALRYQRPLHSAVLDRLLSVCRAVDDSVAVA